MLVTPETSPPGTAEDRHGRPGLFQVGDDHVGYPEPHRPAAWLEPLPAAPPERTATRAGPARPAPVISRPRANPRTGPPGFRLARLPDGPWRLRAPSEPARPIKVGRQPDLLPHQRALEHHQESRPEPATQPAGGQTGNQDGHRRRIPNQTRRRWKTSPRARRVAHPATAKATKGPQRASRERRSTTRKATGTNQTRRNIDRKPRTLCHGVTRPDPGQNFPGEMTGKRIVQHRIPQKTLVPGNPHGVTEPGHRIDHRVPDGRPQDTRRQTSPEPQPPHGGQARTTPLTGNRGTTDVSAGNLTRDASHPPPG